MVDSGEKLPRDASSTGRSRNSGSTRDAMYIEPSDRQPHHHAQGDSVATLGTRPSLAPFCTAWSTNQLLGELEFQCSTSHTDVSPRANSALAPVTSHTRGDIIIMHRWGANSLLLALGDNNTLDHYIVDAKQTTEQRNARTRAAAQASHGTTPVRGCFARTSFNDDAPPLRPETDNTHARWETQTDARRKQRTHATAQRHRHNPADRDHEATATAHSHSHSHSEGHRQDDRRRQKTHRSHQHVRAHTHRFNLSHRSDRR
jgi:hypothetical protein